MAFRTCTLGLLGHWSSTKGAATGLLGAIAVSAALAGSASASTVTYNPAPTTDTGWNPCGVAFYASLAGDRCRTTAFFEPDSLAKEFKNNPGGVSVIFGAAFNAWNNNNNKSTNPAATTAQGWTLTNGGDPGGAFTVSIAKAIQLNNVSQGGAQIRITPNAALITTLNNAVTAANAKAADGKKDYAITWVQGLYDNFVFPAATVPAYYEMDVSGFVANTAGQDPSYCASFPAGCPGANVFLDTPNLRYFPLGDVQAFFFGNAYLGIESLANKNLIVFDGVDYGWHNFVSGPVPEPATWALMLLGFGAMGSAIRARRARTA